MWVRNQWEYKIISSIWQLQLLPHFSTIAGHAVMLWLTFSILSRATYNVVLFLSIVLLSDTLHWLQSIRKASYHLKCSKVSHKCNSQRGKRKWLPPESKNLFVNLSFNLFPSFYNFDIFLYPREFYFQDRPFPLLNSWCSSTEKDNNCIFNHFFKFHVLVCKTWD